MSRLIWSPRALRDVQRLYRFLADKNLDAAKRAALTIRSRISILADYPEIGRSVEDLPMGFRELLIDFGNSGYVVRYHETSDRIVILAVRHQKEVGI